MVCNLKPRKMRGIVSDGMLLCASNAEHTQVEPLLPPEGAQPGQRIHFGEGDGSDQPDPMTPNQVCQAFVLMFVCDALIVHLALGFRICGYLWCAPL